MSETNGPASARGECPACAAPIPFAKILKLRGRPFACAGSGALIALVKTRMLNSLLAIGLLATAHFVGLVPALLGCVLVSMFDWKFAPVTLTSAAN